MKYLSLLTVVGCLLVLEYARAAKADDGAPIGFKRTRLDAKFRSEGVAVGDFNSDG
jgi:hypothetical protein